MYALRQLQDVPTEDSTLHLPRILCLHGGGTNARIFQSQCRKIRVELQKTFRLVFAEAPFPCSDPGSDVTAVYGEWGPFRRWLRWKPEHPWVHPNDAIHAIDAACERAMLKDTEVDGGTGEWVAIMGFSQGAKVAASLLYRQQLLDAEPLDDELLGLSRNFSSDSLISGASCDGKSYRDRQQLPLHGARFRFGVILAGRGPLISLHDVYEHNASPTGGLWSEELADASQLTTETWSANQGTCKHKAGQAHVLQIPSVHAHGLLDSGLVHHRAFFEKFCDRATSLRFEWCGGHRVPLKSKDVSELVNLVVSLYKLTRM